jgi:tetratricopeptide (TPR) repeat protein
MVSEFYLLKGENEKQEGLWLDSIDSFNKAAEILPWNSSYQRLSGKVSLEYFKANNNKSFLYMARYHYEKCLLLNTTYPYHWFELGNTFEMFHDAGIKDMPLPDIYYIKALEIDPTNTFFLSSVMHYHLKKGENKLARTYFIRLIDSYPPAININGKFFLKTNHDLLKFSNLINDDTEKNIEFIQYLISIKKISLANDKLNIIIEKQEVKEFYPAPISDMLFQLGRSDEAKEILYNAYERDNDNTFLLVKIAYIHAKKKEYDKAISIYELVLEKNPHLGSVHFKTGKFALQIGDKDKTAFHFYKALKLSPPGSKYFWEIHVILGRIQKEKGNLEAAMDHYTEAIKLDPENESLRQELKRIKHEIEYLGH